MPNLAVMYSATFPTKPGKRRLHESGQTGLKFNVPINMSGHYYNKKTKAKNFKETNCTIYGTMEWIKSFNSKSNVVKENFEKS